MKLRRILTTSSLMLISGAVYAQYDTIVMCRACPVGTWGNGGNTECTPCEIGRYNNSSGQSECTKCSPGSYQPSRGQTSCKTCDKGYKCPSYEMSSETPCGPGTYQPSAGQTTCISITDGENCSTGSANTSYTSCISGGRTACSASTCAATSCAARYYLSGGECYSCEAGYYCPGDNQKHDCTKGNYCPAGSSGQTTCPKGHKCPNNKMGSPTECSGSSEYQGSTGSTDCNTCSAPTKSCDVWRREGPTWVEHSPTSCSGDAFNSGIIAGNTGNYCSEKQCHSCKVYSLKTVTKTGSASVNSDHTSCSTTEPSCNAKPSCSGRSEETTGYDGKTKRTCT